jgi:hypothetical protein
MLSDESAVCYGYNFEGLYICHVDKNSYNCKYIDLIQTNFFYFLWRK